MNKKDLFTFYITPIFESHKTHITAMKWFPKNYSFTKYNLVTNNSNESTILATLGEDGQVLIWDIKNMDRSVKNDINNYIKPVLKVEVNKMDCKLFYNIINSTCENLWYWYRVKNFCQKSFNICFN